MATTTRKTTRSSVSAAPANDSQAEAKIAALESKISALESKITSLASALSELQSSVASTGSSDSTSTRDEDLRNELRMYLLSLKNRKQPNYDPIL